MSINLDKKKWNKIMWDEIEKKSKDIKMNTNSN
jgi:hypothetical protein